VSSHAAIAGADRVIDAQPGRDVEARPHREAPAHAASDLEAPVEVMVAVGRAQRHAEQARLEPCERTAPALAEEHVELCAEAVHAYVETLGLVQPLRNVRRERAEVQPNAAATDPDMQGVAPRRVSDRVDLRVGAPAGGVPAGARSVRAELLAGVRPPA